ncbi:MAG: CoA transferase, partial [Nocardioides sp.]|nr:CoA transferase [Nocardioides sp.]
MTDTGLAPLVGTVVLDLSRAVAGPQTGMMLGDMGARVIKVESPKGDDSRGWGPPFIGEDGEEATYFYCVNRNKESITLDLKDSEDSYVLARLVKRADVLIENFRTGVLARLGFSVERLHELNPGLVILSITGFGHDGPEGQRAGYDQILQGEGGLMSLTGPHDDNPTKVGVPIADILAGMNGAYGVLSALLERTRTGKGRVVRTSLLAAMVGAHTFQGTRWTVAKEVPGASGAHHPAISPYGMFKTATAPVQVACGSESLWHSFAIAIGLDPETPQFAVNQQRVTDRDALTARIEEIFATAPAEHWLELMAGAGIPAGKVRSLDDVYGWEQTRSQGLVIEVEHAT